MTHARPATMRTALATGPARVVRLGDPEWLMDVSVRPSRWNNTWAGESRGTWKGQFSRSLSSRCRAGELRGSRTPASPSASPPDDASGRRRRDWKSSRWRGQGTLSVAAGTTTWLAADHGRCRSAARSPRPDWS